jgi:hypothetical protein
MHLASPTSPAHVAVSSDFMKKSFSATCQTLARFSIGSRKRSCQSENVTRRVFTAVPAFTAACSRPPCLLERIGKSTAPCRLTRT